VAVPGAGNDVSVQNNVHSYYATNFPGVAPPAAQLALFASQTGAPQAGAGAFDWLAVVISKRGNTLSWTVEGVPIANVDLTTVGALGGSNFALYQSDVNATASTSANTRSLIFGLIDNVVVDQVPEPASAALGGLAALALASAGRRRR
jgi:hypothetical protein